MILEFSVSRGNDIGAAFQNKEWIVAFNESILVGINAPFINLGSSVGRAQLGNGYDSFAAQCPSSMNKWHGGDFEFHGNRN